MSTITSILGTDIISNSRPVINTNFTNLNTDKVESSTLTGSYYTASTITGTYPTSSTISGSYPSSSTIAGTYATTSTLTGSYNTASTISGTYLTSSTIAGTYATSSTLSASYNTSSVVSGTYATSSTLTASYQTTSTISGTYSTSSTLTGSYSTTSVIAGTYATSSTLAASYNTSSTISGTYSTSSTLTGTYAPIASPTHTGTMIVPTANASVLTASSVMSTPTATISSLLTGAEGRFSGNTSSSTHKSSIITASSILTGQTIYASVLTVSSTLSLTTPLPITSGGTGVTAASSVFTAIGYSNASATAPTVPIGTVFTAFKSGVDLTTAATTDIFTVPAGVTGFVVIMGMAVVTAVTASVADALTAVIVESTGGNNLTQSTASNATAPTVGMIYTTFPNPGTGPFTSYVASGAKAQYKVSNVQLSSVLTATAYVSGFYI